MNCSNLKKYRKALIWTIYNCIRNIESSFRTLKTVLDLHSIFHRTDEASEVHLHLGLLALRSFATSLPVAIASCNTAHTGTSTLQVLKYARHTKKTNGEDIHSSFLTDYYLLKAVF